MENDKYPYQKQWSEYMNRQLAFWLSVLAYIPAMFLFGFLADSIFKTDKLSGVDILAVVFILFAVALAVFGARLIYWKCPECGKPFHRKWWWQNIFSSKCLHCKLPKYAGSSFQKQDKFEL